MGENIRPLIEPHNPLGSKGERDSKVGPIAQLVTECLLTLISCAAGGCFIIFPCRFDERKSDTCEYANQAIFGKR